MTRESARQTIDSGDLIIASPDKTTRTVVTPRVIALDPDGSFPLVEIDGWYGLPGGKAKRREAVGDMLSVAGHRVLRREVLEECGVDIGEYLQHAFFVGLAEITDINAVKRQITERLAPIFACKIPRLRMSPDVVMANIHENIAGPLFPDARAGITQLQRVIARTVENAPVFLNQHGKCYFQTQPTKGYVWGVPR